MSKKKNLAYARDRYYDTNRNSRIVTRVDDDRNVNTVTEGRDPGTLCAVLVTRPDGTSAAEFTRGNKTFNVNGRELRTLQLAFAKHYDGRDAAGV